VSSILEVLRDDCYKIGPLQAIQYDRKRTELFPEGYIGGLYWRMRGNRFNERKGSGVLETLFCGMADVSFDAIVPYLAARPLLILGEWKSVVDPDNDDQVKEVFEPAGLVFPVLTIGNATTERSVFAGYTMFRPYWGNPYSEVLGMLGLAYFFVELQLEAILGVRYSGNVSSASFVRRYGMRDCGVIPKYMLRDGKLVSGVVSILERPVFERYVEDELVEAYQDGHVQPESVPEVQPEIPLLFPDIP
jgi:hypothetical protein